MKFFLLQSCSLPWILGFLTIFTKPIPYETPLINCVKAIDGDSIIFSQKPSERGVKYEGRLLFIDAPEYLQMNRDKTIPIGVLGTQNLSQACERNINGKDFWRAEIRGKDKYQRKLVLIQKSENGRNWKSLNHELLRKGLGELYSFSAYESFDELRRYKLAQKYAKFFHKGFFKTKWVSPYKYRKAKF